MHHEPHQPAGFFALAAVGMLLVGLCSCASSDAPAPTGVAGTGGGTGGAAGSISGASGGVSGAGGSNDGGDTSGSGGAATGAGGVATGGSGGSVGAAGGSTGSGGVGGAGGSAAYHPCPTNGDACRVMPLGDSITDGCCGENTKSMGASYRLELFRLSLNNNKKLTFVGSHSSGPNTVDNVAFPKKQEGHSGWTIADGGGRSGLQQQIVGWLNASPPDIITLMIGTNDIDIQLDTANAPKRLGVLIDTIIKTTPNALIVLAQMVPTRKDDENQRVQAYNGAMPALVKTYTDAGKHVVLVDIYGAFTKNVAFKTALLANDLHPSDAGYAVMANTWWDAIGSLLPSK